MEIWKEVTYLWTYGRRGLIYEHQLNILLVQELQGHRDILQLHLTEGRSLVVVSVHPLLAQHLQQGDQSEVQDTTLRSVCRFLSLLLTHFRCSLHQRVMVFCWIFFHGASSARFFLVTGTVWEMKGQSCNAFVCWSRMLLSPDQLLLHMCDRTAPFLQVLSHLS